MTFTAPRRLIPTLKVNSLLPDLSVMKNPSGMLKYVKLNHLIRLVHSINLLIR